MPRPRAWPFIAVVTLVACRYQPSPVQLQGAPADIAALAGTWDGEFFSDESRRAGSIAFSIRAGSDTAFGDVSIVPDMGQPVIAEDAATQAHLSHSKAPELLRITFVRIDGGRVEGALEPYVAPDCKCVVTTVFRGTVNGDRIDGAYVTSGEGTLRQEGRWSIKRTSRTPR